MEINYLMNPKIDWVVQDHSGPKSTAMGTWENWVFSVSHNERGGWDVKINGIQAWTHMRRFEDAMHSVKDRLRDWAYMNQFRANP